MTGMHSETRLFVTCSKSMDSKSQSHAAHIVTVTADIGPDACAPGAVVTRNQGHLFYGSAA